MGVIQKAMARACPHVWFERSEMRDRHLVTKRYNHAISLSKNDAQMILITASIKILLAVSLLFVVMHI